MSRSTAHGVLISMAAIVAALGLMEWRIRTQIPSEVDRIFKVKPKDVLESVRNLQDSIVDDRSTTQWFLAVIDQSEEPWCVVDSGGIVKAWSRGLTRMTGVERSAAIGYGLAMLIPADQREAHRLAFNEAHSGVSPTSAVTDGRCMTLDGEQDVFIETWTLPGRFSAARISKRDVHGGS